MRVRPGTAERSGAALIQYGSIRQLTASAPYLGNASRPWRGQDSAAPPRPVRLADKPIEQRHLGFPHTNTYLSSRACFAVGLLERNPKTAHLAAAEWGDFGFVSLLTSATLSHHCLRAPRSPVLLKIFSAASPDRQALRTSKYFRRRATIKGRPPRAAAKLADHGRDLASSGGTGFSPPILVELAPCPRPVSPA